MVVLEVLIIWCAVSLLVALAWVAFATAGRGPREHRDHVRSAAEEPPAGSFPPPMRPPVEPRGAADAGPGIAA